MLATAAKLGHRPNPMVGALMAQLQSRRAPEYRATIAWINTNPQRAEWHMRPYRRHYFEGASARAEELGFRIDEFWTGEPWMTPGRFSEVLRSRGIFGVIIPQAVHPRFLPAMDWGDFSVVTISQPPYDPGWHCVDSDPMHNLTTAWRNVIQCGYRRPGLVLPEFLLRGSWHACFLAEQTSLPAADRVPVLFLQEPVPERGAVFERWLRTKRPDVVICCDSRLPAIARKAGLRVPQDVGFVHMHLAEDVEGWAGIDQRDSEIGAVAVGLVSSLLIRNERGVVPIPRRSLVPGVWRDGRTVKRRRA